ncbi:MAG: aldo/keto reductase [Chloroflexia bacterium]
MRYKRLGKSGLQVSVIGLGGNTFGRYVDAKGTARLIHRAIDLGINFFDTADIYSLGVSEEHVGKALADRRDQGLICTKIGMKMGDRPMERGLSRHHVIAGVEACLRRLGTDYIDLLQVHAWDPETPLEESMRALDDLVRAGKIRYIGCSNFTAWQLVQSLWVSEKGGFASFVSVQPRYSLLDRAIEANWSRPAGRLASASRPTARWRAVSRPEVSAAARAAGRGARRGDAFFQRQLAGKEEASIDRLAEGLPQRGHSSGELAVAWLASQPEVSTVIAGVTSVEQVEENARGRLGADAGRGGRGGRVGAVRGSGRTKVRRFKRSNFRIFEPSLEL